jgi:hypothetical protein
MSGDEFELYDLEADPGELTNLAAENPAIVHEMAAVLDEWYGSGEPTSPPGWEVDLRFLEPRAVEMLRDLGYIEDPR